MIQRLSFPETNELVEPIPAPYRARGPQLPAPATWNVRRRTAAAGLPGASTPPGDYIGLECSETLTDLRYQSTMSRSRRLICLLSLPPLKGFATTLSEPSDLLCPRHS